MKRTIAITVILACATLCSRAAILAGPITNPANGHTYYLLTQSHWVHAEEEAKSMGGHLVTIDDAAEQTWVYSTFAAWGGIYHGLLIGLNDRKAEGSFRWTSGAPVIFTQWRGDEPNGGTNENAAFMSAPNQGDLGYWYDVGEFGTVFGSGPTFATLNGVVEIDPLQMQIQTSQVAISWNSALDINYQVQYVSSLSSNTWGNLGVPVVGTGSNSVIFDSTLDQPKKFYRVISVP
jgi:hypothetical protein